MGPLLSFLVILLLVRLSPRLAANPPRPLLRRITADMDTAARRQQWASRISLSMLLVPILVSAAFIFLTVANSASLPPWFLSLLPFSARVWIVTGIIGMLSAIVASCLAKWSGDEATLIAIHLMSVLFVWIVPNFTFLAYGENH
jgi:hypothetical protein